MPTRRSIMLGLSLALSLLPLPACKKEPPPKPPVTDATPPPFAQTVDGVFSAWFAARPGTATSLGEHSHDGAWPDLRPEAIAADRRRIDDGLAALAKLPARQREAFLLRYWEDMDTAETAAAMGCSEGSVKTHCSRAVHALQGLLRQKGITL
jgi:RNA polymerase sigma factor (sigma-70 family)